MKKKISHFLKIFFYNFLICLILLLFINFTFLFFSNSIINQKNDFSRKYIIWLNEFYHKIYTDTYFSLEKKYNLVLGDSYGAGDGEEWQDNKYDYSAFHFLKKNTNENFFNNSISGSSLPIQYYLYQQDFQILQSFPFFQKFGQIDKTLILFYEGNDILNNLEFIKNKDLKKQLVFRKLKIYFPLFSLIYQFVYNDIIIKSYFFFRKDYIKDKQKIFYSELVNESLISLNSKQINDGLDIFFEYFVKFKNSNNIYIVYVPSPTTVHDKEYLKRKYSTPYADKQTNDLKSDIIRSKIKKFSEENNYNFLDLTNIMKKYNKKENIYGIKDINHFNSYGYKIMSDYMQKLIFKKS